MDIGIENFFNYSPASRAKKAYVGWNILSINRPAGVTLMQLEPSPAAPMILVKDTTIPAWEQSSAVNSYRSNVPGRTVTDLTVSDIIPQAVDDMSVGGDWVPDGFQLFNHYHIQAEAR